MRALAVIAAGIVMVAAAIPCRGAVVVVSNSLAAMDRGGWHTNGPHISWPSSNGIHWASITNGQALGTTTSITTNGLIVTTQTVRQITATTNTTAFYPASNLFIYRTNLVFNTSAGVLTQAYDAVLSAPNDKYAGVAFPYSNDYRFLITVTNAQTNIVLDMITQTIAFTNYGAATNASMDARQVRIWDTYMALLERAHVQAFDYRSTGDQIAGSNYPLRVAMTVPWTTFYHQPWASMLNEQDALFLNGVASLSWVNGAWLDPAYMTNLLDRVNSITNAVDGSNVKDHFPIGGDSVATSQWFDVYTAYNIPTNYATWLPANLSWLETQPRARVETNRFLTITTNGLVISTAVWTNAPIAVGQSSTNYGLDTLRRLISATRYSVTDPRFACSLAVFGVGTSTNSRDDAISNAFASATISTNVFSQEAGWDARYTLDTNSILIPHFASFNYHVGTLYCGAVPDGFAALGGQYQTDGHPPSDEIAKSGEVYAFPYDNQQSGSLTNALPQVLLESFSATTNTIMAGAVYGRPTVAADFPTGDGTNGSWVTGAWHRVSFGVLDYGITNGFIYK